MRKSQGMTEEALPSVELPSIVATDSDLDELLSRLGSQIKLLRRANKGLIRYNNRLTLALEENEVIRTEQPQKVSPLVTPRGAMIQELGEELLRRIALLEQERTQLRELNEKLAELVKVNRLKTWRLEETRMGSRRLLPAPRAFVRQRRISNP